MYVQPRTVRCTWIHLRTFFLVSVGLDRGLDFRVSVGLGTGGFQIILKELQIILKQLLGLLL